MHEGQFQHVSVAYLQIFCLPNIDNTARAGTDLRLQVVASIFTRALQEAAPCPWPRLVHLRASEVSTAPHSRLDPAPSAEAEAVSVCSGGLKRGSGVNLMIRGLNSHLGSRNSGHTGAAALQYLTMCKYFLSDYAVIFCMTPVRCYVLYAHFLAANFHVCIVWII